MTFPVVRGRRLRRTPSLRALVRETHLRADRMIMPIFLIEGNNKKEEIPSMPGIFRYGVDRVGEEIDALRAAGVRAVLLFGIPGEKDAKASQAYADDGIVQRGARKIKALDPETTVVTDVCLCEYTDHGHCGVIHGGEVQNDPTLELLSRTAVSHARAGADVVAPSDMMDGRVGAIRAALDDEGFASTPILSYAVKYASAFYGPFRDAADSAPQFGDRRGYQMDPPNAREALREAQLDLIEGADMLMVKPALPYLDVVRAVAEISDVPVAAYNVSGEYSMLKAAARNGWLDEKRAILEALTGIARAGADVIVTYHAREAAAWIREEG